MRNTFVSKTCHLFTMLTHWDILIFISYLFKYKQVQVTTICSRTTNLENKSNLLKLSCALLRFSSPLTFDWKVFSSCAPLIFVSWVYRKGFFAPFKNSSKIYFITVPCLTVIFPIWEFPQRYSPSNLHLWNGSQITSQIVQFSSSLNFRMIKIIFPLSKSLEYRFFTLS